MIDLNLWFIFWHKILKSYETNSHDIALIGLPRSVQFGRYIQPACLPSATFGMPQEGDTCSVIGWGKTQEGGQLAKTLQKVKTTN